MQKNVLAFLCLLLSVCVGCGSPAKTETDPVDVNQPPSKPIYVEPKTYEEALDAFYDEIAFPNRKDSDYAVRVDVPEPYVVRFARDKTPEERLSKVGYCIADVSGDGIPELIIGESRRTENWGTEILSLYTMVDGEAVIVRNGISKIVGKEKSRYYLLDEGLLYHEGALGGGHSFDNIEQLSKDGTSVKILEGFSTSSTGTGQSSFGHYHIIYDEDGNRTVEEMDKDDRYEWRSRSECMNRTLILDLIPMSEYKPSRKF